MTMKTLWLALAVAASTMAAPGFAQPEAARLASTPTALDWTPPSAESPQPTADEWKLAPNLELVRGHALCSARRLREWVNISCKSPPESSYFHVRVLGGDHRQVRIAHRAQPQGEEPSRSHRRGTDVIFPMRRGDRRMIEIGVALIDIHYRFQTLQETTAVVISALWLEEDDQPTIVVI